MKTNKLWGWLWVGLGVLYFTLPLLATLEFSLRAQKGQLSLLAYQRVFQDPEFTRYLTWHPHESVEMTARFVQRCFDGLEYDRFLDTFFVRDSVYDH